MEYEQNTVEYTPSERLLQSEVQKDMTLSYAWCCLPIDESNSSGTLHLPPQWSACRASDLDRAILQSLGNGFA
jgi:hypothetical protein